MGVLHTAFDFRLKRLGLADPLILQDQPQSRLVYDPPPPVEYSQVVGL
jgi:hypothetical protein